MCLFGFNPFLVRKYEKVYKGHFFENVEKPWIYSREKNAEKASHNKNGEDLKE